LAARFPHAESLIGRSFADSPMFREFLPRNDEGHYDSTANAVDGTARIFSYGAVTGTPLVISVGLSKDAVLSGWRRHAAAELFATTLFMAMLVSLAWFLLRQIRRQNELNRSIQRSEARYRGLVETANEGIWAVDAH
jgi:PAS domain-containing protein